MSNAIKLRTMTMGDLDQVLSWRNHPRIVLLSTSQRAVTYAEHLIWFEGVVIADDVAAYIVEIGGQPIGHVRVDRKSDNNGVITVYLDPDFSGRGIGVDAIRDMCKKAYEKWPTLKRVIACVRNSNDIAVSAFKKAGFHISKRGVCSEHHVEMTDRPNGVAAL